MFAHGVGCRFVELGFCEVGQWILRTEMLGFYGKEEGLGLVFVGGWLLTK